MWYAVQANNWDQPTYQIDEMKEIQETGEVTRPQYASALKGFESGYLDPLLDIIKKKEKQPSRPSMTRPFKVATLAMLPIRVAV